MYIWPQVLNATLQVRGHVHKMMGSWLAEFTDLRQSLVLPPWPDSAGLRALAVEVRAHAQHHAALLVRYHPSLIQGQPCP